MRSFPRLRLKAGRYAASFGRSAFSSARSPSASLMRRKRRSFVHVVEKIAPFATIRRLLIHYLFFEIIAISYDELRYSFCLMEYAIIVANGAIFSIRWKKLARLRQIRANGRVLCSPSPCPHREQPAGKLARRRVRAVMNEPAGLRASARDASRPVEGFA